MDKATISSRLRDILAVGITGVFLLPLLWWALTSVQPDWAIFNKDKIVIFSFTPNFQNYIIALGADGPDALDLRATLANSVIIAAGSSLISVGAGLMAAFALSRLAVRSRRQWTGLVILFRMLPPIAIILPCTKIFHDWGLFDTRFAVILMHGLMNLPLAVLMLMSFLDDLPRELDEAARLDGASSATILLRILMPLIYGGLAATATLCALFSWTEFLISLFLSVSFRTVPVQLSILSMGAWGPLAAAGTMTVFPAFCAIVFLRRYLVRALTLGTVK